MKPVIRASRIRRPQQRPKVVRSRGGCRRAEVRQFRRLETELQGCQSIQQQGLAGEDLSTCGCERHPLDLVDFGEGPEAAAAWRPLDVEGIAAQCGDVEVTLERESDDLLAA